MTTDDYITTTGERWHEGAPFNEGWIPTLLRDESENDEDCTIVRPPDILAELRALRAQRDEKAAEWGYYDEEIARCREIVSQHRGGAEPSEELHNDVQQLVDDVVALRAQRDRTQQALALVDETQGCCGPGEWCHFKTYSELALEFTDVATERDALRAQRDELQGQLQCAGIISDHAIKLDDDRQSWKHKARELEKQRDELLAALERMRLWVSESGGVRLWYGSMGDDGQGHDEGEWRASEMLSEIDALIARAKGGA